MTEIIQKPSIYHLRDKSHLDCKLFLDEAGTVDIARFETCKYPIFQKQADMMDSMIWKPEEINLTNDRIDYNTKLEPHEQHIFTANIKSQIAGDSFHGRGLSEALLPIVSDSSVESCIMTISYFENRIHSRAYTHILRNVYNNPSEVFDSMKTIPEITRRAKLVANRADDLIECTNRYHLGLHRDRKEVKRRLYLYLVAINALEAIQFYFSFACSFNFGQTGRMKGNASEIQLIANDEAIHVAWSTALIRLLPQDDPDFVNIIDDTKEEASELYHKIIEVEKTNVEFVLQKGSMMGMNIDIGKNYVDFRAAKSMKSIGLEYKHPSPKTDPLPWMRGYVNEGDIQKPPQESDLTGYIKGLKADTDQDTFKGFEL